MQSRLLWKSLEEVAEPHHGEDRASSKSGAGGRIRETRSSRRQTIEVFNSLVHDCHLIQQMLLMPFVVQDAPTEESRLAALNQITRDAPLAEIVNVVDADNATSSSNRSRASLDSEAQQQKLLLRGGFILLLVLTATLVPLAGLGELSRSTHIPTPLNTMVPSGVPSMAPTSGAPSMAPTSGAPSMAPTTPARTPYVFSTMASRIFTNPEEERPRDPTSPQWKALMWLAYKDGYNTTISSQLVRRYALTTLRYATNGEGYVMYQCVEGGKTVSNPGLAQLIFFVLCFSLFHFLLAKMVRPAQFLSNSHECEWSGNSMYDNVTPGVICGAGKITTLDMLRLGTPCDLLYLAWCAKLPQVSYRSTCSGGKGLM
jgi:hypothetical protein